MLGFYYSGCLPSEKPFWPNGTLVWKEIQSAQGRGGRWWGLQRRQLETSSPEVILLLVGVGKLRCFIYVLRRSLRVPSGVSGSSEWTPEERNAIQWFNEGCPELTQPFFFFLNRDVSDV